MTDSKTTKLRLAKLELENIYKIFVWYVMLSCLLKYMHVLENILTLAILENRQLQGGIGFFNNKNINKLKNYFNKIYIF